MHTISPEIASIVAQHKNASLWVNEAKNALRYITPYLDLPDNSRVLEVGSGACILLGHLALQHKNFEFTGMEPIGPGFQSLKKYINSMKDLAKIDVFEDSFEKYETEQPFDLVFLINVFEHLPDWKFFLQYAQRMIGKKGKCVILCPNYGFPIKSHYGLPIMYNKSLTHRIFSKYINNFDQEHDCNGLWDSLNFVKFADVKKQAESLRLNIEFNPEISFDFIRRLDEDEEFRKRHSKIAGIAQFANKSGVLNLFKHRLFWNYHPYMHLEITQV